MKRALPGGRLDIKGILAAGVAVLAMAAVGATALVGNPGGADQPTPSPVANGSPSPTADASPGDSPTQAPASPSLAPSGEPSAEPSPTTSSPYAPLDGMPADEHVARRLPLAVMIDNNGKARPQAGFNAASIVYQAPNDGGTDRYMLFFQEQDAKLVGPVRSTRPFFVAWTSEYRPALAHFGGDWKAVKRVAEINGKFLYDIDALEGSARAYWRDDKRRAPFNAYTSTDRLWAEAKRLGAPGRMVDDLPSRTFADDLPAAERPTKGSIFVPYRHGDISYDYDHQNNRYLRSIAGRAQRDAMDDERVTARNVIVQFVDTIYDPNERYNRAVLQYVGKGRAIVFRDGLAIEGRWTKSSETELTRFVDQQGKEISLVRGPIYVQVVPARAKVSYELGRVP